MKGHVAGVKVVKGSRLQSVVPELIPVLGSLMVM